MSQKSTMKIAIATSPEGTVFHGHFAHAPIFKVYRYENGKLQLVEEGKTRWETSPTSTLATVITTTCTASPSTSGLGKTSSQM
jgi:predicted Fe-Mo cluster-binding NifX family protein